MEKVQVAEEPKKDAGAEVAATAERRGPHTHLHGAGHDHHHHHGSGKGHKHEHHHGHKHKHEKHEHHTPQQEQKCQDEKTLHEIVHEENRVRHFGMPDNVFKFFAGYQVIDGKGRKEIMMSPKDFYCAVTPDTTLSHAVGDGVYTEVPENELSDITKLDPMPDPDNDSVLNAIGKLGLFSYQDFYFLLTILSTPARYIDTAFQMFDITGGGNINAKEFAYVSTFMTQR